VLSPFPYDVRDPTAIKTIPQLQFTPRTIVDQTFAMIDKNRGQASRFSFPLLMMVAPTDHVIDSRAAEAYFEAWGTSDKKLVKLDRSGHMIPLDYDWEMAATAIAEFAGAHLNSSIHQPSMVAPDEPAK
jgi:carboxylesterase